MPGLKSLSVVFACAGLLGSLAVMSADQGESPGADADPAADIADVFIFNSPESAGKLVGAITFGGRSAPRSRIDGAFYCDPKVLYSYFIDRADALGAFDGVPDIRINMRFGASADGRCGIQFENIPGAGGTFSGQIEQIVQTRSGLRGFAGLRNDPFFFDSQGLGTLFNTFAAPGQNGDLLLAFGLDPPTQRARRDSFGRRNVSSIVFELGLDAVAPLSNAGTRPKIRVWATTGRLAT